jgi:NAD(P)-dependent dehydrogenase (short-subunit alcohol dehydrogenase family)
MALLSGTVVVVSGVGPGLGRSIAVASALGIRVNSVVPGYIWADSLKWYFGYLAEQRGVDRQQIYDETAATTDLRKLPEPGEVADAVVFLASSMARVITGQCLDVNSGEYHH